MITTVVYMNMYAYIILILIMNRVDDFFWMYYFSGLLYYVSIHTYT